MQVYRMMGIRELNVTQRIVLLALTVCMPMFALMTARFPYEQTTFRDLALPVLVVELIIVAALILQSLRISLQALKQSRRYVLILCALWIVSIVVSAMTAPANPSAAYYHLGLTLMHVLIGWLLLTSFTRSPQFADAAQKAVLIGLGVYGLIVLAFAVTVTGGDAQFWRSLGAGVTNVRHLSNYALILFCLSAAGFIVWPNREWKVVASGVTMLALFLIYWTGGRGAFLASHIVFLMLLFLYRGCGAFNLFKMVAIGTIIVVPLAHITAPPSPDYGPLNMLHNLPGSSGSGQGFSNGRSEMWQQAVYLISERPWFGYGEAQYRWVASLAGAQYNHPHNVLLQLLFQWGLVGTTLFVLWLCSVLPIWRLPSAVIERQQMPAFMVVFGLLGISLIDGPLFYHFPALIFAVCLAAFIAQLRSESTQ